jgi:hypothetical protein
MLLCLGEALFLPTITLNFLASRGVRGDEVLEKGTTSKQKKAVGRKFEL